VLFILPATSFRPFFKEKKIQFTMNQDNLNTFSQAHQFSGDSAAQNRTTNPLSPVMLSNSPSISHIMGLPYSPSTPSILSSQSHQEGDFFTSFTQQSESSAPIRSPSTWSKPNTQGERGIPHLSKQEELNLLKSQGFKRIKENDFVDSSVASWKPFLMEALRESKDHTHRYSLTKDDRQTAFIDMNHFFHHSSFLCNESTVSPAPNTKNLSDLGKHYNEGTARRLLCGFELLLRPHRTSLLDLLLALFRHHEEILSSFLDELLRDERTSKVLNEKFLKAKNQEELKSRTLYYKDSINLSDDDYETFVGGTGAPLPTREQLKHFREQVNRRIIQNHIRVNYPVVYVHDYETIIKKMIQICNPEEINNPQVVNLKYGLDKKGCGGLSTFSLQIKNLNPWGKEKSRNLIPIAITPEKESSMLQVEKQMREEIQTLESRNLNVFEKSFSFKKSFVPDLSAVKALAQNGEIECFFGETKDSRSSGTCQEKRGDSALKLGFGFRHGEVCLCFLHAKENLAKQLIISSLNLSRNGSQITNNLAVLKSRCARNPKLKTVKLDPEDDGSYRLYLTGDQSDEFFNKYEELFKEIANEDDLDLWKGMKEILNEFHKVEERTHDNLMNVAKKVEQWRQKFTLCHPQGYCNWYVHYICRHLPDFLYRFQNVAAMSNQALENFHLEVQKTLTRSTQKSHWSTLCGQKNWQKKKTIRISFPVFHSKL
jgi:hypothetical protein